jgi:4-amino-4-deoxy-L-arabinose transferase-like glycosyltransferase
MNRTLLLILAAGLLIRLGFWSVVLRHPERTDGGDTGAYVQLARNLQSGAGYTASVDGRTVPEAERTPGYPLFIAAVDSVFPGHPEMIALFQNLLDGASILLLFLIGRTLAGAYAGLAAAALYALHPAAWLQNQILLTEPLFIVLFLTALWCLARYSETKNPPDAAGAVLACAAAAYVRPTGLWLGLMAGAAILGIHWKDGKPRAFLKAGAALLLFSAVVGTWGLRNARSTGRFFFSTNSQKAFVVAHVGNTLARAKGIRPEDAMQDLARRVSEQNPEAVSAFPGWENAWQEDPGLTALFFKEGCRDLARNYGIYLKGGLVNLARMAFLPESGRSVAITQFFGAPEAPVASLRGAWKAGGALSAASLFWQTRVRSLPPAGRVLWVLIAVFAPLTVCLALLGILSNWIAAPGMRLFLFLSALTLLYFFAAPGLESSIRYRLPVEPLLCLLGGLFLHQAARPRFTYAFDK